MEIRDLEYLAASVTAGNFARAAEAVGISTSTISRRVARLEDELGLALFERGHSGVRLTPAGRNVMLHARRVLGDLEALKTSAFGRMGLPADWVLVKETGTSVFQERSRFFGYEAVRTLLHLAWDGSLKALPAPKALLEMCRKLGYVPLNVDVVMNNISLEEGPGGFYAIYGRVAKDLGEGDFSRSLYQRAAGKIRGEKDDYYSQTLYLLAQEEIKP